MQNLTHWNKLSDCMPRRGELVDIAGYESIDFVDEPYKMAIRTRGKCVGKFQEPIDLDCDDLEEVAERKNENSDDWFFKPGWYSYDLEYGESVLTPISFTITHWASIQDLPKELTDMCKNINDM